MSGATGLSRLLAVMSGAVTSAGLDDDVGCRNFTRHRPANEAAVPLVANTPTAFRGSALWYSYVCYDSAIAEQPVLHAIVSIAPDPEHLHPL